MNHQISLPSDLYFLVAYVASIFVLIGVLLFAVRVKEYQKLPNKK